MMIMSGLTSSQFSCFKEMRNSVAMLGMFHLKENLRQIKDGILIVKDGSLSAKYSHIAG